MKDNIGLKLENLTDQTIEIDLFNQGQVGGNAPQGGIRAANGYVVATASDSTSGDFFFLGDSYTDTELWKQVSLTEIELRPSYTYRFVTYSDDSIDNIVVDPDATLEEFGQAIQTAFEVKNGQTGIVSVDPTAFIISSDGGGSNYTLRVYFNFNYLVNTSQITYLAKQVYYDFKI